MALSLENALAVKQQASSWAGVGPGPQMQLKAFWMYHAQHGKNKDLDFIGLADLTGDTVVADAACQLYVVYLKKQATATDAFAKFVDHATTAAGSTFFLCAELAEASEEVMLVFPNGIPQASGITAVSSTTDTGTTDTTSGDGPNGYCIIGAA